MKDISGPNLTSPYSTGGSQTNPGHNKNISDLYISQYS